MPNDTQPAPPRNPGAARAEAALLIADGWRVWPISRTRLTPARAGFARADGPDVCATEDEFTDDTEVGVLCGPCPAAGLGARFVCVDYDGPVPDLARVGASGAPTLTSKYGAHAWYRIPPGVTGFRQTQRLRSGVAPGGQAWAVDTRDFGGYARETKNGEPLWDDAAGVAGAGWPRDLSQAEVDDLFGPAAAPAPARATPYQPPARVTAPSQASVASFVLRVVANPEATNACFGAVGSCLAAWGWENDAIAAALEAWFAGVAAAGLPGRHLASALRAADTRRSGAGLVPGFPKLAELGVVFEADAPAGGASSAEELWALIDAEPTTPDTAPGPADESPWRWRTGVEIAAWDPPPIPWLSEELCLAPGAPGLITGYGGTGKTTFVQHLALCVVSGAKLLDQHEVRHGAVTHLDYEQGADLTMRRYLDLGLSDLPTEAQARLRFASFPSTKLTDDEALAALLYAARGQALLIVDSLVAATSLDDENAAAARKPLDMLGQVSELTGCVVLVIHHSKKDRSNGRVSARGSSAITDAVSVHITYERPDEDGAGAPVTLALEKVRNIMPKRAFVEAIRVTLDGAGRLRQLTDTDERSRLAGLKSDAETAFREGFKGTITTLAKELSKRRGDVSTVVAWLIEERQIQREAKTGTLKYIETEY